MDILSISIFAALIAGTAFFVASKFALVKVRGSHHFLATEGDRRAVAAKAVISHLDEYIFVCQLGITITTLGIGWLGAPMITSILEPIFVQLHVLPNALSILLILFSFICIMFMRVVIGEITPKAFAIQKAEYVILAAAKPLIIFKYILYPFIWTLNTSVQWIFYFSDLHGVPNKGSVHSEEEFQLIVDKSYRKGEISKFEYEYVMNVFEFSSCIAKEIMVPRTEISVIEQDCSILDAMNLMSTEKYTRYPIIDGNKDQIIGMVNFKDIFTDVSQGQVKKHSTVALYIRPILQVIESIPIRDLFLKMQTERAHMAILVDEYGGTSGLVTIEDMLEEIFGEIQDEFDVDEQPEMQQLTANKIIVEGKVNVTDVNYALQLTIDNREAATIGGWVLKEHFHIQEGDSVQIQGCTFCVLQMDGYYIQKLEITKQQDTFRLQQLDGMRIAR